MKGLLEEQTGKASGQKVGEIRIQEVRLAKPTEGT